jgi:hypothetical protein
MFWFINQLTYCNLLELLTSSNKKELLQQMQQFERIVQRMYITITIEEIGVLQQPFNPEETKR